MIGRDRAARTVILTQSASEAEEYSKKEILHFVQDDGIEGQDGGMDGQDNEV
ncbi:MAG TPA: hypothetical protein VFS96_07860 [Nitrolancea sp.]|nr:hypothetical protein [Nitrolancea sp.]